MPKEVKFVMTKKVSPPKSKPITKVISDPTPKPKPNNQALCKSLEKAKTFISRSPQKT